LQINQKQNSIAQGFISKVRKVKFGLLGTRQNEFNTESPNYRAYISIWLLNDMGRWKVLRKY
jgi:hypothetical protein